jgi:glycosyltransferase involved in cell wall biosynthesis
VGGTHPALIEAMGFGNCVIANGTPENREVVRDAAVIFEENSAADLAEKIRMVVNGHISVDDYRGKAVRMIEEHYTWEKITDAYEKLFRGCLERT